MRLRGIAVHITMSGKALTDLTLLKFLAMQLPWSGHSILERGPTSPSSRGAAIWLAGLALIEFIYFLPRWNSYNEDARVDVVLSVVDHGSISINPYHLNTKDETRVGNNFYSNKAPGQSLLGVPVYAGFRALASIGFVRTLLTDFEHNPAWNRALADAACNPPVPGDHCRFVTKPRLDFAVLQYLEAIITVAIPSVLMLLLFYWLLGFFSVSVRNRTLLTLGVGLGTIVFPYS